MLNPLSDDEMEHLHAQALALYEDKLKAILEPEFLGQVVAIHPESGEYAVARNSPNAMRAMRARHIDGFLLLLDIGPVAGDDTLTLRMLANERLAGQKK